MDWITDLAYRTICKQVFEQYGNPEDQLMLRTEFMSADGYIHNPPGVVRHLRKTEYEPQLIAQIFGGNAETLVACAKHIQENYNFAWIELNMGCPSPKLMKCEAGGGMMKDKKKTLSVIKAMANELTIPFSLKTRIGLTQEDVQEQFDFVVEASQYVHMITIHGRTYKQSHAGEVDWNFIYRLKQRLPDKVINGNGGIRSYQDALDHLTSEELLIGAQIKLDGIMPAQSAIGNPWILTPHTPTIEDRREVILRHLDLSMASEILFNKAQQNMITSNISTIVMPTLAQHEELMKQLETHPLVAECRTPVEFRKYLFNYISGLPEAKKLKVKIATTRDYFWLKDMLIEYFNSLSSQPHSPQLEVVFA